jgi:peroxiredoxin
VLLAGVLALLLLVVYDPYTITAFLDAQFDNPSAGDDAKDQMKKQNIVFNQLKDIPLGSLDGKTTSTLAQVCEGRQGVVLSMLRRFGCVLCRDGAAQLSLVKPELDALNVALVGVAPEHLGQDEFTQDGYFKGELFVDEPRALYTALHVRDLRALCVRVLSVVRVSVVRVSVVRLS